MPQVSVSADQIESLLRNWQRGGDERTTPADELLPAATTEGNGEETAEKAQAENKSRHELRLVLANHVEYRVQSDPIYVNEDAALKKLAKRLFGILETRPDPDMKLANLKLFCDFAIKKIKSEQAIDKNNKEIL